MIVPDPAGLLASIANLDRPNRHALTVAACELRDRRVAGGDHRVAAVFAELAALVAEVDDEEADLIDALAADIEGTAEQIPDGL